MPKVRQHSRISDELPAEIRAEVNRLLIEPGVTYDDIQKFLAEKGYDISRSGIGRYGKGFLAIYQKLRIVEDKSKALVSEAGEGLVLEEAASKLFVQKIIELQMADDIDLKDIPRILSDFAKLQSASIMRERLKGDYAKKAEKAADDVVKVMKKEGLSAEKAAEIRKKILGVVG